jgi:hypothetical protein
MRSGRLLASFLAGRARFNKAREVFRELDDFENMKHIQDLEMEEWVYLNVANYFFVELQNVLQQPGPVVARRLIPLKQFLLFSMMSAHL